MNLPRWVIPVVATVVAIAVGVTATLLAVRFAPPETARATAETIQVPVRAPVDDGITLEELVAAGDQIPVSPTLGRHDVVDPDSVPEGAVPEELADLLDELDAADDPADAFPPAAAAAPGRPAGDPCADSDTDCPEGAPGTIMTLDGDLPPLQVWSTGGNNAECSVADEPGSVRFWARANAPVTFTMRVSQGEPRRQIVETTDEQIDRWVEESLAGPAWIEYCIEIADLIGDRSVIVYLDATDELGRRATRALTLIVSDGLAIPPTRVYPIGDSTVFVSAPHSAENTMNITVMSGDRETEPLCPYDPAARGGSLPTVRPPSTEVVSADYLESRSYEPEYSRRTNATFAVPANTPLIVCVGWFPRTDSRPSYDRSTPLRVSEYRMTSPDVVAPVVSVSELVLTERVADGAVRLRGSTENGQSCGSWSAPPFRSSSSNVLCDFGSLLGSTDAGGSLLVTTEVDRPEGEAINRVLLDVGLLSCVDGCSGRTRSFDVELSKSIRPSGICTDDCSVGSGEVVGVARLRATWPASTAGTGEGWVLGAWREGSPVAPRDPSPQLDTTSEFVVVSSGFLADRAFSASAAVRADRPVTVVAELLSNDGLLGPCTRPGGTTRWESSSLSTTHTVEFAGLCLGTFYSVLMTLTAEDGSSRSYSAAAPTAARYFWPRASFSTPADRVPVVVDDVRLSVGEPTRVVVLNSVRVFVGGTDVRMLRAAPEQNCWVGDVHGLRSGLSTIGLGERIPVRVTMRIGDGRDPVSPTTDSFPTRCTSSPGGGESLEFSGYISYSELVAGATLTIPDPDTGYSVQVRLTDRL